MIHKDALYNNIDNIPKNCSIFFSVKDVMMMRKALERRQHLNCTIREGLSALRQSFGHIPATMSCLLGPSSASMPAWPSLPTTMEMGSFSFSFCQLEGEC